MRFLSLLALLALAIVPASASAAKRAKRSQDATGLISQTAIVDWSGGQFTDKEAAGFTVPGIGRGKLVCRPNSQYLRIYPSRLNRETSMIEWTYKDWDRNKESAIRGDLKTKFSGASFAEGINKFSPAEKHSTGQFDGVISDRGIGDSAGGVNGALAPPTTFKLTWVWNFDQAGKERCYARGVFVTERPSSDKPPLARSAQLVWRGDKSSAGRDYAGVEVPGLGTLGISCQAGPAGDRSLLIDTPVGATVTTREASDSEAVPQQIGPVAAGLPNNGMVFVTFDDGRRVLVSSRWKVNDPDLSKNFCAIAAQAVVP